MNKGICIIVGCLLVCHSAFSVATPLEPDIPVSYVFSNLTVVATSDEDLLDGHDVRLYIAFGGAGIEYGEGIRFRFYADKDSLFSYETWSGIWFELDAAPRVYFDLDSDQSYWLADSEGRIEFEQFFGTVTITEVKIVLADGTGGFLQTEIMYAPTQIPSETTRGTPFLWLSDLGYNSDWEAADLEDYDKDGFLNWQEFVSDTDAADSADYLRIGMSGGDINFESSLSCVYSITYRDNLVYGNWNLLTNNIYGNGDVISITPSHTPLIRYYKITAERNAE
ncbi:MAG: hypothetical protein V5783_00665 [Pontiella sp.]